MDSSIFTYKKKIPPLCYLREYFFPSGCGGCGKPLLQIDDAYYGLCDTCRNLFTAFLDDERHCALCGKPLITEHTICLNCRQKENQESYNEWITKMYILFPYAGKFKKILGTYKFGKSTGIGHVLFGYLTRACDEMDVPALNAAWVPVPPRPGKIKKQGWDQVEFLASLLEKERRNSGGQVLPVNRCLKRLHSRSQKELNREERKTNLKGRILCAKKPPGTAILFDDVFTTGATMDICAAALRAGGAGKVYGICLFYD